jgi:hypothetical protein
VAVRTLGHDLQAAHAATHQAQADHPEAGRFRDRIEQLKEPEVLCRSASQASPSRTNKKAAAFRPPLESAIQRYRTMLQAI